MVNNVFLADDYCTQFNQPNSIEPLLCSDFTIVRTKSKDNVQLTPVQYNKSEFLEFLKKHFSALKIIQLTRNYFPPESANTLKCKLTYTYKKSEIFFRTTVNIVMTFMKEKGELKIQQINQSEFRESERTMQLQIDKK